jgi:hypothetical protein
MATCGRLADRTRGATTACSRRTSGVASRSSRRRRTSKSATTMRAAAAEYERMGIRFALVGGLAVGAQGWPRATKHVDFLVDESPAAGCARVDSKRGAADVTTASSPAAPRAAGWTATSFEGASASEDDPLADEQLALASCYGAAAGAAVRAGMTHSHRGSLDVRAPTSGADGARMFRWTATRCTGRARPRAVAPGPICRNPRRRGRQRVAASLRRQRPADLNGHEIRAAGRAALARKNERDHVGTRGFY